MTEISRRTLLAGLGVSLLAGPVLAQGRDATPAGITGRVFVNERGGVRIHTYLASPQGAMVTSHVVETGSGLVLVDGQFAPGPAGELKRYVESLGKPVQRLILSHAHPDHWFGIHHLGRIPVHTGAVTAKFLKDNGAAVVAERKADSSAPEVAGIIAPGTETIGGVEFRFRQVMNTEAPEITVVEIPAAGAVIVQDLVYNKVHAVVSRQLGEWISTIKTLERDAAKSPLILAGHGEPASPADLPGFVRYLETVKPMVDENVGKEGEIKRIVDEMQKAFPDYRMAPLLQLGLSRALKA